MGMLDDAKDKVSELLHGKEETVKDGIDTAAGAVADKVGEGNADKVEMVADKAKDVVDKLAE